MSRFMIRNGIETHKRHNHIVFTKKHKHDRVALAERMLILFENDPEFWKRIIWSDEKMFKFRGFDSKMESYGFASTF